MDFFFGGGGGKLGENNILRGSKFRNQLEVKTSFQPLL